MKKSILITFVMVFFSCEVKKTSLSGSYRVYKLNYFQNCINYITNTHQILGVNLELKQDSTFVIGTCSYYAVGKWHIKGRSLFLNYSSKKTLINSINSYKEVEKKEEIGLMSKEFIIKKNHLIQYDKNDKENYVLIVEKKPDL